MYFNYIRYHIFKYIKKYLNTEVFEYIWWIVLNTVKYMGLGELNISGYLLVDPAVVFPQSTPGSYE